MGNGLAAAAAAGPLGAITGPFDAAAIGGIWSTMLLAIADKSNHKLDEHFCAKFITTVGTGSLSYYGGCKAASYLFHLIPGAGTLLAMGISTTLNVLFTYKFGAAVTKLFDKETFDFKDAARAATTVLAHMCTRPTIREIQDIKDLYE